MGSGPFGKLAKQRTMQMRDIVLIGYSGHAYVVAEILLLNGFNLIGYCEYRAKEMDPFKIPFLGLETDYSVQKNLKNFLFFPAVGDNIMRQSIFLGLKRARVKSTSCTHPASYVSPLATIGDGVVIMGGVQINPLVRVGDGAIINTNATIEHECVIGNFAHIAPGAVLAGNVTIGDGSLIGANAVIKPNITVGCNVIVGAGSVVINDIPDNLVVKGVPAK